MAVAPFRMLGKRDEELGPSTARRPRTHPPSNDGARPRAAVGTAGLRAGAARLQRALKQSVRRPPTTAKVVVRPGGAIRDMVRVRARVAVGPSGVSSVFRARVRVRVLPQS